MPLPAVVIDDSAACVDDTAVRAGLDAALGDRVLARLDTRITLEELEGVVVLAVHAAWGDERWDDLEELTLAECGPRVARLAIDSVVRGTSGWRIRTRTGESALVVSGSGGVGPWQVTPQAHAAVVHGWGAQAVVPVVVARLSGGVAPMLDPASITVRLEGTWETPSWIPYGVAQVGAGVRHELPSLPATVGVQGLVGALVGFAPGLPYWRSGFAPAVTLAPGFDAELTRSVSLSSQLELSPFLVELGTGQDSVEPVRLPPVRLSMGLAARL